MNADPTRTALQDRLARLAAGWVYGGVLAALVLLGLFPVLTAGWSLVEKAVYLALPAYMFHQYEEHDDDRFRRYVNDRFARGREVLTADAMLQINFWLVWVLLGAAIGLVRLLGAEWAVLAGYLLLTNALLHMGQAVALRGGNPGLVTSILLFLPLGLAILGLSGAGLGAHLLGIAAMVLLHAGLVLYLLRRLR
ncbi:MAG: HXXEE domain-containing protein [Pseudomonadota bacterium]